jgi:hypothetical protein
LSKLWKAGSEKMSFTPTGFVAATQFGGTGVVAIGPPHAASAPVAIMPPISCARERESRRSDICYLREIKTPATGTAVALSHTTIQ